MIWARTIAFPSISTGVYHFPMDRAAGIAMNEVILFLLDDQDIELVSLVAFSDEDEAILRRALQDRINGPTILKGTRR